MRNGVATDFARVPPRRRFSGSAFGFTNFAKLFALYFIFLGIAAHTTLAADPSTRPILRSADAPVSLYANKSITRTSGETAVLTQGFDWQRLVMAMAVVIGVIIALRYAVGLLFPAARATRGSRAIRVLTRTPLAPRQQVMLLQVGRRVIVVGESGGNLSSLGHIDEPDEVAELIGQIDNAESPAAAGRFRSLFGRARSEFAEGELTADAGTFAEDRADLAARSPVAGGPADVPEVREAAKEIAGLIDRMRSLTKTMRH